MSTTGALTETGAYACDGYTTKARQCKRTASVHLAGKSGQCLKHYCRAHAQGKGIMKLLLPMPWEYDHVEVYS